MFLAAIYISVGHQIVYIVDILTVLICQIQKGLTITIIMIIIISAVGISFKNLYCFPEY
jgi:hypothetical protein